MLQKRFNNRLISTLLIFCFVFATLIYALPVYAVDSLIENEIIGTVTPNDEFVVGEKLVLKQSDVPEIMSFSEAQSKGHVYRLRERETDMNTLIFLSDDNTQTMYVYPQAVKYADADGNIKDKSTALTTSGTDLVMADNDVNVRFPQSINHGITVSKDDKSISMMPSAVSTSTRTVPQSSKTGKNNKAIYTDAFGDGISLEYTATFSGVKEDIILESYTGKTEFSFVINTNGLYPVKNSNGSVSFYDPSTDAVVAEMMQVYCIDAANNFAGGDIEITEMKQNQKYIFTVVPDVEFLTADTTVYPVTVDPTITMNDDTEVEDAVIYSGKPTHNYGDHRYATIGYLDDTYKKGEYLVKFSYLSRVAAYTSDEVTSAYFHIYTASGGGNTISTINTYAFRSDWEESTVTWNSVYPTTNAPSIISYTQIPYNGTQKMSINVLNAAKGWVDGTYDANKGLLLRNASTSATFARDFLTVEYATSKNMAYMPYLEINVTTEDHIILEGPPNNVLHVGESYACSAYLVSNGIIVMAHNGTNFAFDSSNYDIIDCSYGILKAEAAGKVTITASSGTISASIVVTVLSDLKSGGTYEINYDRLLTSESVSCNINAHKGDLDADEGITYSIESNELSTDYADVDILDNGVVKLTRENNNIDDDLQHIDGEKVITVKATYTNGSASESIYIPVSVTCEPFEAPSSTEETAGIELVGGRYIKINYTSGEKKIHYNDSDGLQALLDSYSLGECENVDNVDFVHNQFGDPIEDDYDWAVYLDRENGTTYYKRLLELVRRSRIACIITHGAPGTLSLNATNSNVNLTTADINKLHDGYFAFCHLVLYTACATASSGGETENDLLQATVDKGAKAAVGFTTTVEIDKAQIFELTFFSLLSNNDVAYKWNPNEPIADDGRQTIYNAAKEAARHSTIGEAYVDIKGPAKYMALAAIIEQYGGQP